jgi:glycosyltransferase involved in cell wall biosynthesis
VALDRVDRNVLYQAVPKPANPGNADRPRGGASLVIGRLCTPTTLKWPETLVGFYSAVASRRREVEWEFVGCPQRLQGPLEAACGGRARFHEAGWDARLRLWTWDALLYHHPTVTESFGRTAADAMRAGCVPIVDDRGGFREQIAAGAGWLCRSREEFSFAIDELADGKARLAMSRRAMAHADRHFSIARFRRDLLRVLKGNR